MSMQNGESKEETIGFDQPNRKSSVQDDSNYSHRRRLQAIHDARAHVIRVRNEVEDALIQSIVSERDGRRYYRGAVESFILEAMPVLKDDNVPFSEDYLHGLYLGDVVIHPPEELVQTAEQNIGRLVPGSKVPTPNRYHVQGLADILEMPSPVSSTFTVSIGNSSKIHQESETVVSEIPRSVLDKAVQKADEALNEAKMGVDVGEGRPHHTLAMDGKWPWEIDGIELPHEIKDRMEGKK